MTLREPKGKGKESKKKNKGLEGGSRKHRSEEKKTDRQKKRGKYAKKAVK